LTSEQALKIDNIENTFLREENHVSATIARNAYHVFQFTPEHPDISAFSGFYRKGGKKGQRNKDFSAYDVERLSNQPEIKPSWTQRPSELVYPVEASGDLEDRCSDFRNLDIPEQNADIMWKQSFYGKYYLLKELSQTDRDGCYTAEIMKMENTMKAAQRLWDKKFGKSVCEKVAAYLSPKRKRDNEPDSPNKRAKPE